MSTRNPVFLKESNINLPSPTLQLNFNSSICISGFSTR